MSHIQETPSLQSEWGGKNLTISDVVSLMLDRVIAITGEEI